ncbi:MAG: hypothetical protein NZZ41_01275 [Candidatus Dojkabacteria bacterium]|nr:hypothetical protein [Candidatus Dojkabacteria bacterium]
MKCKSTIIGTSIRDGIKKSIGSKRTKKYTKDETVTHDIIYDFLLSLAETSDRKTEVVRFNLAVNSDKQTIEVVQTTPLKFNTTADKYFSKTRFELLIDNYIDRKRQNAKRLLDNILSDYSKAFGKEFKSLDEINRELFDEFGNPIYTPEQVAKLFDQQKIPFILDYHYVVGTREVIDQNGNKTKKRTPELKKQIIEYIQKYYHPDPKEQNKLNEIRKTEIKSTIESQRNSIIEQGLINFNDYNIYYSLMLLKSRGLFNHLPLEQKVIILQESEKQAIRRKILNSTEETISVFEQMGAYNRNTDKIGDQIVVPDFSSIIPDVIDEFLISWMNASEEYHSATIGSSVFYKGGNEVKQFIERGKRGAMLTSTIQPFDLKNPFGVPRYTELVIVEDPKQEFQALVKMLNMDIADGASFSTELLQIQYKNSLGNKVGQPTGSHIKDLGVFKDFNRETASFKKNNNFVISHERIRKSQGNKIDFKIINDSLYRQSSLSGLFEGVTVPEKVYTSRYRKENGEIVQVSIKYVEQQTIDGKPYPVFEVTENGKPPVKMVMKTVLDLYNALGNAFTVNENNEYTKMNDPGHSPNIINEILSLDVLLKTYSGKTHDEASEVKSKMKLGFNFVSAIKSSQTNINPLKDLLEGNYLMSTRVEQTHLGMQLNAAKDTDDKEATLPTQIVGALGLTSYTPEYSYKAFEYLKELVTNSIDERLTTENIDIDPVKKKKLYDVIRELSLATVVTTKETGLVSYILSKSNIPLDNPQISKIVIAAINSYLSSEGIRKNIFGNQYVLAPPIQVYEDEHSVFFGDKTQRRKKRLFVNRLLENGTLTEDFLKRSRRAFYKTFKFVKNGKTLFVLSGKEALKFQLDIKTNYLFRTSDMEKTEKELKDNKIPFKIVGNAFSISFKDVEEMDKILDILLKGNVEIDYDNTTPRDLKPARVKYVLQTDKGLVVTDLYSTEESKFLRYNKGTGDIKEKYKMINQLEEKIQEWNQKSLYIIKLPGEIIAPKSWKSKFLLKDTEDLSDIKGEDEYFSYFLRQINENPTRSKHLDDMFMKNVKKTPLYIHFKLLNKKTQSKTIKRIEKLRKKLFDNLRLLSSSEESKRDEIKNTIEQTKNKLREILAPYYAKALAKAFKESLKSVTTRIPLQSLASVMSQEIVGFLDTEENTAMINNEHQSLTGGDYDVDKTNYLAKYVTVYGLHETSKEKKEYWLNKLLEQIYEASIDDRNMLQRETGVDMTEVESVVEEIPLYPFRENHYLSTVELKIANMIGKDVTGIAANMIKVYSTLNVDANKKLDEFVKLYDKLKNQKEEERDINDINKLNELFNSLLNEFVYELDTTRHVQFLSNLPPKKVMKLYQYAIADLYEIDQLPTTKEDKIHIPVKIKEFSYKSDNMREEAIAFLKKKEETLKEQHKTADMLGQMLNAAVDNAKHIYLGRMNVDVDTAPIVMTMLIDGIDLKSIVDFLSDDKIKKLLKDKNSNFFEGYPGKSLMRIIESRINTIQDLIQSILTKKIELKNIGDEIINEVNVINNENVNKKSNQNDFVEGLKENIAYLEKYKKVLERTEDLNVMARILSINQGLNPTSFGVFSRISFVNNYYDNKVKSFLRKIENKYSTNKTELESILKYLLDNNIIKQKNPNKGFDILNFEVVPFDFVQWVENEEYRQNRNKIFKLVNSGYNIFEAVTSLPNVIEQLKIMGKSMNILKATSPKFNAAIAISNMITKERLVAKPFNEQMFERYLKAINMYIQDAYLDNAPPGVHVVQTVETMPNGTEVIRQFDLKNINDRINFIKSFNQQIMNLKRKYPGNEFLKILVLDESKVNEHGQTVERIKSIFSKDIITVDSSEIVQELAIKSDLKKLGPGFLKALRYYNLLIYQDSNARGSFTSFFTNPELFDSYWNFEASITSEQLINALLSNPKVLMYYLTKAGIYDTKVVRYNTENVFDPIEDDLSEIYDAYSTDDYLREGKRQLTDEESKFIRSTQPIKLEIEINGQVKVSYKRSGDEQVTIFYYQSGYITDINAPLKQTEPIKPITILPSEQLNYRKQVIEAYNKRAKEVIQNLLQRVVEISEC